MHNKVLQFLEEVASVDIRDLDVDSSIELDLGITGDDADELIYSFAERFRVDISGFDIDKYFHSEPSIFSFRIESEKMRFSIKDLIVAAGTKILT
ncbi:DUF1493 family protein [Dyadobacter sp.]|uniref:DUF1493 family protein n=1 Tax=Dyadobacter sp. TaxID=1914288 RepID=UPI0025C13E5C|nr:DUF1493 family protein [Dyadobacter sp.]